MTDELDIAAHDIVKAAYIEGAKDILNEWKEVCECAPLFEHTGIGETADTYWKTNQPTILTALRSNRAAIIEDNPPTSATFNCGWYDDGSGPKVEVRYDFDGGPCSNNIWIEKTHSDQWFAFDEDVAEEVCAAIMKSARAIRSLNGGDHGSTTGDRR